MKKVTFCLILLLALLCLLHAQADTVTFESVSQATVYVRKNQPMKLTLKDVRFRPSELYTVYNAMPAGSEFHFSTTWGKIPFTDEARTIWRPSSRSVRTSEGSTIPASGPHPTM